MGVHVDGGLREFITVPTDHLIAAPGLEWDQRALVECLAIGAHAVRRAVPEVNENVVVIGVGPIGLGVLQFARAEGARVIAVDLNEERLRFWSDRFDGGDDVVLAGDDAQTRIFDLCGGDFPTVVVDATGSASSMIGALQYVAHGGRLVYVGLTKQPFGWAHPEFHKRETTLLASRNATREDFARVMSAIRDGIAQPSCLITHRTGLGDVPDRFEAFLDPGERTMKALVDF